MGHSRKRTARQEAERGGEGKLIARAEAEFGPLDAGRTAPADAKKKLARSFARQAAGERRAVGVKQKALPALIAENFLTWQVLAALYEGRQFQYVNITVGLPMGGVITRPEVVAFNYEALLGTIKLMVPKHRRREVFEKFRWVAEYALRAARGGGGDGKGSDD